jgi:hypothetical protein
VNRDSQFRVSGDWALSSDGIQWILQYRSGRHRKPVKFIRSTKDWLAYRLRQLAPPEDAEHLLDGLPDTFEAWGVAGLRRPLGLAVRNFPWRDLFRFPHRRVAHGRRCT